MLGWHYIRYIYNKALIWSCHGDIYFYQCWHMIYFLNKLEKTTSRCHYINGTNGAAIIASIFNGFSFNCDKILFARLQKASTLVAKIAERWRKRVFGQFLKWPFEVFWHFFCFVFGRFNEEKMALKAYNNHWKKCAWRFFFNSRKRERNCEKSDIEKGEKEIEIERKEQKCELQARKEKRPYF